MLRSNFLSFGFALALMNEAGAEGAPGGGGQPAQQAPVQQPPTQQEPAQQVPAQEPSKDDTKAEPITYEPTGDPTLDYALSYFGEHGLGGDHPAVQAALDGSFEQLEVELLRKGAAGADKVLALAKRSYEQHQAADKDKIAETGKALVEVAGSLDNWEATVKWARENGDPSEKEAINALLQQGGLQAKIAARYLVEAHRNAAGTTHEAASAVSPGAASNPVQSNAPLSRVEFAQESEKLYRKLGDSYNQSAEYRALVARRQR